VKGDDVAIDTMLYPPTAEECADFEAFCALAQLSLVMEDERLSRVPSDEAVEFAAPDNPRITDAQSFAAVLRPSGVRPRPMRFAGRVGTRRGYSSEVVWDGMERIFRRHVGEPSGIPRLVLTPGGRSTEAAQALSDEFFSRCPVAEAWRHFFRAGGELGGELDYSEPIPATAEEYASKRFGELLANEDQRRGPSSDQEERTVQREIRALSRPRRLG